MLVVVIGFVPDDVMATEGVNRSLSLTAKVVDGELGLDVFVGVNVIGNSTGILCMIYPLNEQYYFFRCFLQINQILKFAVVKFSHLVLQWGLILSPLILLMMMFLKPNMNSLLLVYLPMKLKSMDCSFLMPA